MKSIMVVNMASLYVAMILGFISIRWWRMFKSEHCDALNRFNCFFVLPFFTFHFLSQVHPYRMNYHFVVADIVMKATTIIVLALWANFAQTGSLDWSLTTFSLSTMSNTLVAGIPFLQAMYRSLGYDIARQAATIQFSLWLTFLLFGCEYRRTRLIQILSSLNSSTTTNASENINDNNDNVVDLEQNNDAAAASRHSRSLKSVIKAVLMKLSKNLNSYACFLGLVWALISNRWTFRMPSIIENCISPAWIAQVVSGVKFGTIDQCLSLTASSVGATS